MASNVVIVHNNRKYTVKTTPSMLCRDILVQGCQKVGLKNVENYGLKYDDLVRTLLTTGTAKGISTWHYQSVSLVFSQAQNLKSVKFLLLKVSPHARLLIVASKPITLALQCSNPQIRLTGTFPPTATLMEVLLHFEQESGGQLVVFGRKGEEAVLSVLGREFAISEGSGGGGTTTLAGMGVGGNVLIRLGFRKVGMGSTVSSGSGTTDSSARSPIQTVSPTVSPPPASPPAVSLPEASSSTSSVPTSSTSYSPPVSLSQDNSPIVLKLPTPPPIPPPIPEDSPPSPMEIEFTDPPSPSLHLPPLPPGPENRNRIVYNVANASTPAAAKRTPQVLHLT
jgi:TUG ubiquitin-like domain